MEKEIFLSGLWLIIPTKVLTEASLKGCRWITKGRGKGAFTSIYYMSGAVPSVVL